MNSNIVEVSILSEFVKKGTNKILLQAIKCIKQKGRFSFVLSGGRTPILFFEELVKNYSDKIEWEKVDFFWLDERYTSSKSIDSNYYSGYKYLISKLKVTGEVFRIQTELSKEDASLKYSNEIKSYFKDKEIIFDFMLIGMGEDGHVASIFPKSKELERRSEIALTTEIKYNAFYRISLGIDVINNSGFKLLVVNSGKKKAILFDKNKKLPVHEINYDQILILNDINEARD